MEQTKWMNKAIELARSGMNNNEGGPFGCVIVKDGVVVGRGWNQVSSTNDPTAHAEVVAIRDACKNLNTFQLEGCEVYASCEPCPMCLGAIYWARASKIYFAATKNDAADAGFDDSFIYKEINLDIADRSMKMECFSREEALGVFREWLEKNRTTQ